MGLPQLRQHRDPQQAPVQTDDDTQVADDAEPRRRFPSLGRRKPSEARVLWHHGDALATRLLHIALMAALISGPAALSWVALTRPAQRSESAPTVGEPEAPEARDETLAAAAAQRLVLTWLTASASDKASIQALLVEQLPADMALPEKRPPAPDEMWVGEIEQRSPGRYRVIIATTGGAPGGQAYFTVPVRVKDGVAAALSLPGRTRPPSSPDPDTDGLAPLSAVAPDDPAFQAAAGYVTAYLTGSAELDRWTAPGAELAPVTPAACRSVHVDRVETATENPTPRVAVIATATCQVSDRSPSTTQYGLVLQVRDGRWEVVTEDPALLLDPNASTTEASTAAPPTASPSSTSPTTPR